MKRPAKITTIKKAIKSLTNEQYIVLYLNGTSFGVIDEPLEDYEVDKIDDEVLELSTGYFRLYFNEFEIKEP